MKRIALFALVIAFGAAPVNTYAAECTGSASCRACKNCKYRKHCATDGGSCGVCKRRSAADAWREAAARDAELHAAR